MTTSHTPGPWHFYTEPQPNGCPVVGANGLMVAMLAHSVNYPDQKETALANARLIAAAPDYHDAAGWILAAVAANAAPVNPLAALEEMALDGKHVTLDAGLVLDLLKAHAKAKGEQQ